MTDQPASESSVPVTFESAFSQLETLVERLESGGLSLDQAMDLYEAGMALVQVCTAKIDAAELRLTRIQDLESGDPGF